MKKILLTTALILALTAASANAAEVKYEMKYEKMPEDAVWGGVYKKVAVDRESGRVIPISECDTSYGYAYVPEGTEIAFKEREAVQFNDIDPRWGGPAGLDDLSRRGIFSGDENGNFNGSEILTRAQMTALLSRIIGADGEAVSDMPFTDVPKDAWFASSVYALYSRGIVAGDELFNPERPVTREELVTMEYRIIKMLGGKFKENAEMPDKYIDFDSVSEYAKLPYSTMEASLYHVPYDYVDTEPFYDEYGTFFERFTDKFLLNPQNAVSRGDAAMYLDRLITDFIWENSPAIATDAAVFFGLDEEMPRITGSTSSYPITQSAYGMLFTNYNNHPMFPESHDKTIDSYKLLLDGKTDIIIVPDPNNEVKELAAEKGVELEYIPIADEALVFFTAADNPADNLTSADIERIYIDNSVTNWNEIGGADAGFTAFCRNGDSGSHAQMEQFFLHGREINEDIRREHMSLAMSSILTEVDTYNKHNAGSYALGYSMYFYFQNAKWVLGTYETLKLLSVDGAEPTAESLADGSYPLSTHYFAVIRSDEKENSPARKFAAFLTSEAGQICISNAGFGARK